MKKITVTGCDIITDIYRDEPDRLTGAQEKYTVLELSVNAPQHTPSSIMVHLDKAETQELIDNLKSTL